MAEQMGKVKKIEANEFDPDKIEDEALREAYRFMVKLSGYVREAKGGAFTSEPDTLKAAYRAKFAELDFPRSAPNERYDANAQRKLVGEVFLNDFYSDDSFIERL